jgi:hypothetical protein
MPKEKTLQIKKQKIETLAELDHLLTGDSDELSQAARTNVLVQEYQLAKKTTPNYGELKSELLEVYVKPPTKVDVSSLPEINGAYAMAQSYYSRCVTIGMLAEDNATRWKRVKLLIIDYIEEKGAEIMTNEEIRKLKNSVQEAMIRTKLRKLHRYKNKIETKLIAADSFRKIVEHRKNDLEEVLTTLAKQVKALALERDLTRH